MTGCEKTTIHAGPGSQVAKIKATAVILHRFEKAEGWRWLYGEFQEQGEEFEKLVHIVFIFQNVQTYGDALEVVHGFMESMGLSTWPLKR